MDRRRFLAAASTGAVGMAAGCAGTGLGTTRLGSPAETVDDDGKEKHLRFDVEGDRLAVISLDQMTVPATADGPFRLNLHVAHRSSPQGSAEPTTIERFRFDLRAPPSSVGPPAEIYLKPPGGPSAPGLAFHRTAEGWTRIEATDAAAIGSGTLTFETVVRPVGEFPNEIGLRGEVALSTGGLLGRRYVLEALTRFEPVRVEDGDTASS